MRYTMMQVCKETGMTYQALKFYCNEGLVPNVKRDKNNRRVFDERDVAWISSLMRLKKCGMGIQEMKDYLALCLQGERTIPQRKILPAQKQEAQDAVYAFVGAPERVVLNCDRIVLDDVLDRFGTDIQVFERDEQTFTAVLTTPPRGVKFWALQYLSYVEVAEPAWLRDEIMESITRNRYGKG